MPIDLTAKFNSISVGGVPMSAGGGIMTQGKSIFVKPYSGSDGNTGLSATNAVKTLSKALSLATADQNDVVYMFAESNTAANTTDYQSSTLDWNKDGVHLIGINSGGHIAQRSRVAWLSTASSASDIPLFTLSADGCMINGIHFFCGLNDANMIGAMKVTGSRNNIVNCHIAGIGHDTNDAAGAYSLMLDAAAENSFVNCLIGLDTIARGSAANSEILVDTAATRNEFIDCFIISWLESATNHPFVKLADATAIDRWLRFKNCTFLAQSTNYGTAQNGAFKLGAALTQGYVIVEDCKTNAAKWDVDDNDKILLFNAPTPAADTAGVYRAV